MLHSIRHTKAIFFLYKIRETSNTVPVKNEKIKKTLSTGNRNRKPSGFKK